MSARAGCGISKEELRRILAHGFVMCPEDLVPPSAPSPGGENRARDVVEPPLVAMNIDAVNAVSADMMALWPAWRQRLERVLDDYRRRRTQWEGQEWLRILSEISECDWACLWANHAAAPLVASTYLDWVQNASSWTAAWAPYGGPPKLAASLPATEVDRAGK